MKHVNKPFGKEAVLQIFCCGICPSLEKTFNIFTNLILTYLDVLLLVPLVKREYIFKFIILCFFLIYFT